MSDFRLMNYTSTVPVEKTILDIERLLSRAGASKITKDYAGDGTVIAFFFAIPTTQGDIVFRMPCDVDKVYEFLISEYKRPRRGTFKQVKEQASRVAWRILLDWTSAQLSMIKLNQVKPQQAFLAYAYDPRTRQTLFEKLEEQNFKLLGAGDATE